ncbi:MAG: hypothetical protein KA764_13400 [Anaerolineales bacterium]|nr:hypothetical protein [Anaerolineales bacterium]
MHQLSLTTDEAEVLQAALQSYISDLRQEVSHTENWQFKAALKQNEAHLRRVLDSLSVSEPEVA